MDIEDEETASTSSQFTEGTAGKWNSRNKRLLKHKVTMAYLLKAICSCQESCIEWLKNRGLLPKTVFCPTCNRKMRLEFRETSVDNYVWTCKDCKNEPSCFSVRHGTWLEKREEPLVDILLFTYLWTNNFNETQIVKETNMDIGTVRNWSLAYLDICESALRKSMEDENGEDDYNFKATSKETPISIWRKKNKLKDPFLEFLRDADSVQ